VFTVDSEPTFEGKTFTDIYELAFNGSQPPVNISSVIGKIVTQINGMPTLDYLQLVADSQGTFKSAGVRLNSILKGGFVSTTANTAPLSNGFETYTFSDGTTADFSGGLPVIYNSIPFANIANLQALVVPRIKVVNVRGEEEESFNNKIKMAVRKMSPFEEQRRNQELEERLSLPLSSLKTLNVSLENSVIAGSIILNGVEHVVLQITTFGPAPATANNATLFKAWLLSFQAAIKAAVDYGQTQGINNLIIDLTGNPGGVICLSVATRIALFPGYAANPGSASCPSDYRLSTINQYASVPYVLNNGEEVPQCSTTTISDNRSWFYPLANHTRGGITSAYTNLFGLDCFNGGNNMLYSNPAYLNWAPTWFFSKVIALTDGTCGSACSQFLSEAMADGTVTAISYGGRPDSVTDTSSFCGGNVEDWTLFVPKANAVSYVHLRQNSDTPLTLSQITRATTQMTFSNLPTTATMNFNFMESYVSGGSLPREFTQMPATANLNIWPVFSKDITGNYYLFSFFKPNLLHSFVDTLYGQAVAYFASAITSPTTLQCKIDVAGNTLTAVSTTSSPASGVQSSFVETLRQLF